MNKEEVKSGEMVYNWYRLDKNISWFNVSTFVFGLIYGVLSMQIFRKSGWYLLRCGKIWLPPRWDTTEGKANNDN